MQTKSRFRASVRCETGTCRADVIDDAVRSQDDTEQELLKAAAAASDSQIEDLVRKWRHPTFSIANVSSSGASNNTIIPRRVTSDVSFRLVPDQVSPLTRSRDLHAGSRCHCQVYPRLLRKVIRRAQIKQQAGSGLTANTELTNSSNSHTKLAGGLRHWRTHT